MSTYTKDKDALKGIENDVDYFVRLKDEKNTRKIYYKNGNVAIRLHKTDVITFTKKNTIILDTGGYKTSTTKTRINSWLPYNAYLSQKNYAWNITCYDENNVPYRVFVFYDKMEIELIHFFDKEGNQKTKLGKIVNKDEIYSLNNAIKLKSNQEISKLKKEIKNYVNLLDNFEPLPLPQNSDCWYCLFRDKKTQKTIGDFQKDKEHLHQHLKENYMHGSIIYNAIIDSGYQHPSFVFQHKNIVKRALYKYLTKRLILENF